jgi:hypothetical protein
MIAPHVPGPFVAGGWRERRAHRTLNPLPLILSNTDAEYNDRRDLSGLCLATRLRNARLQEKEDHR